MVDIERAARNEAIFREINERIREQHDSFEVSSGGFLCECWNTTCEANVNVPLVDYGRIRSNPRRFFVAPGHDEPEVEVIVEDCGEYVIVEKVGEGGRIAEELAGGDGDAR